MGRLSKLFWVLSVLSFFCLCIARISVGYWENFMFAPLVMFLLFFIVAIICDRKKLLQFFSRKTTKNGTSLGLFLCLVFSIFIAFNVLIKKYNQTWDLTKEGIHQLAPQTKNILTYLDKNIRFDAFYNQESEENRTRLQWLLEKYQRLSKNIEVNFYDMDLRPDLVQKYSVKSSGTVILSVDGRVNRIEESKHLQAGKSLAFSEQEITNAIVRNLQVEQKVIYFLVGHNEKSINDSNAIGLSELKKELESRSYEVRELRLIENKEVPKDANAVAIIGPEKLITREEIFAIKDYLAIGGKVFVAADPGMKHGIANLTKVLGIRFLNQFIVDFSGQMLSKNAALAVGGSYSRQHIITNKFDSNAYTFFPVSSNLEVAEDIEKSWNVVPLLTTGDRSFTQPEITEKPEFKVKRDQKGPLNIFYAISGNWLSLKKDQKVDSKPFKALVVGDSDFMINQFMLQQGFNRDLVLNSFSYLLEDHDLISINPKKRQGVVLYLSEVKMNLQIVFYIVVSLLLFVISGVLWWRRRS